MLDLRATPTAQRAYRDNVRRGVYVSLCELYPFLDAPSRAFERCSGLDSMF